MEQIKGTIGKLTVENVVWQLQQYIKRVTTARGGYVFDKDIFWTFSFYMDFASKYTNLYIVNRLHEIMTDYLVGCECIPAD